MSFSFFRADSASYQAKLFDYCQEHDITYTVGARRVCGNISHGIFNTPFVLSKVLISLFGCFLFWAIYGFG
jgi:hypothetical protein